MTVREMIQILLHMPQDLEVYHGDTHTGHVAVPGPANTRGYKGRMYFCGGAPTTEDFWLRYDLEKVRKEFKVDEEE